MCNVLSELGCNVLVTCAHPQGTWSKWDDSTVEVAIKEVKDTVDVRLEDSSIAVSLVVGRAHPLLRL